MKKRARTRDLLDLSSTSEFTVAIEGVPVTVHVDANGRPLSARCRWWETGEERERLHRLALRHALRLARDKIKKKREPDKDHFSGKWLAAAREKQPDLGADRLALAARRLLAEHSDDPNYGKRAKITEYRAKEYLRAIKKSGET